MAQPSHSSIKQMDRIQFIYISNVQRVRLSAQEQIMSARNLNLNRYRTGLTSRAGDLKKALRAELAGQKEASLRLLRQIEYALWRMARGRYGECVKCEGDVEPQRL